MVAVESRVTGLGRFLAGSLEYFRYQITRVDSCYREQEDRASQLWLNGSPALMMQPIERNPRVVNVIAAVNARVLEMDSMWVILSSGYQKLIRRPTLWPK